jgi:thiosulfate dehydrogenase [quinone] large subunit
MAVSRNDPRSPEDFRESRWALFLFRDSKRAAWLWLVVRVYLGSLWLDFGLSHLRDPAWAGSSAGSALASLTTGTAPETAAIHAQVPGWYNWLLDAFVVPNAALFSYLLIAGGILIGIALILGAFTGIAAFVWVVLNANFLLAGIVGPYPLMIVFGVLLVLAWRNAGWIGLDRRLLPAIGTPWQPGEIFMRRSEGPPPLREEGFRPDHVDGSSSWRR